MIRVEPDELFQQANRLQAELEGFEQNANLMLETVSSLKNSWRGADNEAYSARLLDYQKDVHQLGMILSDYILFLKQTGTSYQQIQQDLISQANGLQH